MHNAILPFDFILFEITFEKLDFSLHLIKNIVIWKVT